MAVAAGAIAEVSAAAEAVGDAAGARIGSAGRGAHRTASVAGAEDRTPGRRCARATGGILLGAGQASVAGTTSGAGAGAGSAEGHRASEPSSSCHSTVRAGQESVAVVAAGAARSGCSTDYRSVRVLPTCRPHPAGAAVCDTRPRCACSRTCPSASAAGAALRSAAGRVRLTAAAAVVAVARLMLVVAAGGRGRRICSRRARVGS